MTHRRAEIVSDLVSEGDVGDFRGNMGSVVLYGDDACVQRLLLPIRVQLTFLTDNTGTTGKRQKHTPHNTKTHHKTHNPTNTKQCTDTNPHSTTLPTNRQTHPHTCTHSCSRAI